MNEINELQENLVSNILGLFQSGKEQIGIKAPTGSGKTHMMAMLMNELLENDEYVFIISSLSKGDLAEQCYKSFVKNSEFKFKRLKPYLILAGNEKNAEYTIQVPLGYNAYVLPTNQLAKKSLVYKEKAFLNFLLECKNQNKKIVLIRDESHITTNNLDEFSEFFECTIDFSATPKGKFDLILTEDDAVRVKLIKSVEYIDNNDELESGLTKALRNFKDKIKPVYQKQGISPAFIVQISKYE